MLAAERKRDDNQPTAIKLYPLLRHWSAHTSVVEIQVRLQENRHEKKSSQRRHHRAWLRRRVHSYLSAAPAGPDVCNLPTDRKKTQGSGRRLRHREALPAL